MESLMREMGGLGVGQDVLDEAPGIGGDKKTEKEMEQQRAFRAAWEAMLVEEMNGMVGSENGVKPTAGPSASAGGGGISNSAAASGASSGADVGAKHDFQAGIRAAMDKLKSSESGFKVRIPPFHHTQNLTRRVFSPGRLILCQPFRSVRKPLRAA